MGSWTKHFLDRFYFFFLAVCIKIASVQSGQNSVILIAFDGLGALKLDEYLKNTPNSNFSKFIHNGVRAEYMQSSFPSFTFPNLWSIVTGVYPGYHGIVANTIYDPTADLKINLISHPDATQARWWNRVDPIWLDAKRNGLKAGAYYWTANNIEGLRPDYYVNYSNSFSFEDQIDTIISWQIEKKLDFTCGYLNEPDHNGHIGGPDSKPYMDSIGRIDEVLGYLMNKIADNNLTHVNIILVSDHGITKYKKAIYVRDYLDLSDIDLNRTEFSVISNIHPRATVDKKKVFDALNKIPNIDVYYKEQIPARFNYQASDRIAPILAVAKEGYFLTLVNNPNLGFHGYDPNIEAMRAIFLAQGPAFRKKVVIDAFENVNVKPLICGLLRIDCPNTNGTIYKFQNGLVDQTLFNSATFSTKSSLFGPFLIFLYFKLIYLFDVY